MKVGVLGLQGNFREHVQTFRSLGVDVTDVRLPKDLEGLAGLVVPGGESTTIGRLAREFGLEQAVRERFHRGDLGVWGTCAGAIWVAKEIEGRPDQERLGICDIVIGRNAYGRQLDSFVESIALQDGEVEPFPAIFIRAPVIRQLRQGSSIEVLAEVRGDPVLIRQGRCLVSTFHPELTGLSRIHEYFLNKVLV
jgi:5'-phosphate synthase pdxT subunit